MKSNYRKPKKTLTYKGTTYRSGLELRIAKDLTARKIPFTYESSTISFNSKKRGASCGDCNSTNILVARTYTPDFFLDNGVIIESKGRFRPSDRTIIKDVIKSNPELDIRMVFEYNNWLTKKKKQRYSDWCDKQGIKYALKEVPEEWTSG